MVEEDIREIRNAANRALTGVEMEDESKIKDELAVIRRRLVDVEGELGMHEMDVISFPNQNPDEVEDVGEPEDEGWGIIGTEESHSSRVLEYPDTDTRQFEVLAELGIGPPSTMERVAARSEEVGKSRVSSALSHLYDKKMIEAKKRRDVNYYYLSEEGEDYLESEEYDVNSEHKEYRRMFNQ